VWHSRFDWKLFGPLLVGCSVRTSCVVTAPSPREFFFSRRLRFTVFYLRVRQDKDGVCAAAVFAEMAGELARRGLSVTAHLDALFQHYGYFLTNNRYVFVDDPRKTVAIFTRLRNEGTNRADLLASLGCAMLTPAYVAYPRPSVPPSCFLLWGLSHGLLVLRIRRSVECCQHCAAYTAVLTPSVFGFLGLTPPPPRFDVLGTGHYWKRMGRFVIANIRDLTGVGLDTEAADLKPVFPTSSSSQMITYKFTNG
jgi:hypothetical protein